MAKLVAMYGHPTDPPAFDAYYDSTHVPLAKTIPGLRHYDVSSGPVASSDGTSDFYLIATLSFDSMDAIQEGLASAEGQKTAADLGNFADGGVQMLMFDTREV